MTQKIKPKYRIGNFEAALMIGTALILWVIQFLCSLTGVGEVVSEIIGFVQNIMFFIWFVFKGINYFGKNALTKFGLTLGLDIVEVIPFLNDIPAMIIQVVSLILISRKEDMEKAVQEAAAAEKAAQEQAIREQQYYNARMRAQAQQAALEAAA